MGIVADRVTGGLQTAIEEGQKAGQKQAEAVKELLVEIRDNANTNAIWMMEAIQMICNKLDIKLRDPLEIEETPK